MLRRRWTGSSRGLHCPSHGHVYYFIVLLCTLLLKWRSHDSVKNKHEHVNCSLVTLSTTSAFILSSWTHTNTRTLQWAMLRSFEPRLNILAPDLRLASLPWQHKCYSVMSVMGWEQGESGVKPHVPLNVCVRWSLTLVTIRCHCYFCLCVCSQPLLHIWRASLHVCDTLQITGLPRAGCKARWLVTV